MIHRRLNPRVATGGLVLVGLDPESHSTSQLGDHTLPGSHTFPGDPGWRKKAPGLGARTRRRRPFFLSAVAQGKCDYREKCEGGGRELAGSPRRSPIAFTLRAHEGDHVSHLQRGPGLEKDLLLAGRTSDAT